MTAGAPLERRLVAVVHGRVQGVGFRWFVQREASRMNVTGWVDNRSDGAVRVVAEGDPGSLQSLLARLREGPLSAAVTDIDVRYEPPRGHMNGFVIRSGAHRGD